MLEDRLHRAGVAVLVIFFSLAVLIADDSVSAIAMVLTQDTAESQPSETDDSSHSGVTLLQNLTIHPGDGRKPFEGSLLIQGRQIQQIGPDIEAPQAAVVHDLSGFHATPGLIESRGKIWLTPAAINETNSKAGLDIVDGIDPWSEDWRELNAQGITTAYVQPASASFLGGYGAVVRVGPNRTRENLVMQSQAGVQASIGLTGRTSRDRFVQQESLKKLLEAARKSLDEDAKKADAKDKSSDKEQAPEDDKNDGEEGDEEPNEDDADDKESSESGTNGERNNRSSDDTAKTVLSRVLKKEIPLLVEVHHPDSLQGVLALAEEYDFRLVVDGLGRCASVCSELESQGVPFCVGPLWPETGSTELRREAEYEWLPSILQDGRLWTLSGFPETARGSTLLRTHAARAVRLGIDPEQVLMAMTLNAARLLGVSDRVGSLTEGKEADIVIFAGDPMDPATPVRMVFQEGRLILERAAVKPVAALADTVDSSQLDFPATLPDEYRLKTTQFWDGQAFIDAMVHVKNGTIVEVSTSSAEATQQDLPTFDVGSAPVTGGLVAGHTMLGQRSTIQDDVQSDMTYVRAVDAVDPTTTDCENLLCGGFVHVAVSPGNQNVSAGSLGHLRLGAKDYVADPAIASQFVLNSESRDAQRFPASLNGQQKLLAALLEGQPMPGNLYVSAGLKKALNDQSREIVKQLKEQNRVAVILADTDLEIQTALSLIEDNQWKAVLLSQGRLKKWVEPLTEAGVGILVPPANGTEYQVQLDQLVTVGNAGVPLVFAGDRAEQIRTTAALLVQAGLEPEIALKGLTVTGGQLLGMRVAAQSESPADLVIWNGSPLNPASKVVKVLVDGQVVNKQ